MSMNDRKVNLPNLVSIQVWTWTYRCCITNVHSNYQIDLLTPDKINRRTMHPVRLIEFIQVVDHLCSIMFLLTDGYRNEGRSYVLRRILEERYDLYQLVKLPRFLWSFDFVIDGMKTCELSLSYEKAFKTLKRRRKVF